jgi:hypothetical protein
MKKRTIWGAIAALGVLYAARMGMQMMHDLKRYNHILSLSNEGTVQDEMPELLLQVAKREKQTGKEWMTFFKSFPKDVARYLKIESM